VSSARGKAGQSLAFRAPDEKGVREPFHISPYSGGRWNVKLTAKRGYITRPFWPALAANHPSLMTLLYANRRFLDHQTGAHPESPVRLEHIARLLDSSGLADRCTRPAWQPAGDEELLAVHDRDYLNAVAALSERGGGRLDPDTVVSPDSFDVARLAAAAACDATRRVLAGEDANALCLVRPPGHHALADRAMGFCLINNVAVAARLAIDQFQLDRVLIVDWDVHHGNGTQDIFYDDPQVAYFSIHRWPFYPGTGAADETGRGEGLGATKNLPIAFGTPRPEYLTYFAVELERFAAQMKPQLVLVSAGFDSHAADPIGSLGLETEDFGELTRTVLAVANTHAAGRIVSVLEGGYNPPVLAECVALHLKELLAANG
jgi:acetoin utilization deacetylase AcuC-like enzyme